MYIGQTKYTLERRWKAHLSSAKKYKSSAHFPNALRAYNADVWSREILVSNLSKEQANYQEAYYIELYNTFHDGYNSTLGGDYFDGYVHSSGITHHSTDKTIYTLYHKTAPKFVGTRLDFCTKYSATTGAFNKLLKGKQIRLKGFALTEEGAHRKITRSRPSKTVNYTLTDFMCSIMKKSLIPTATTKKPTLIDKYILTNKRKLQFITHNPTKGKQRPQYVKDAVSKRRKNEADKTLRTWVHPVYGIEKDIRSLDLRDKYNLNISHLNKIVTINNSTYRTHKGWSLAVQNNTTTI